MAATTGMSEETLRMHKLVVTPSGALPEIALPPGVSEDYVDCRAKRALTFHTLEAGYDPKRPLVLLLHGFPGLAYSWRKVIPTLASADNYVVAFDQRGYGRTIGWDERPYHDVDLKTFSLEQYVRDTVALVNALGYRSVRCIIGHDFGARIASLCCLMVPDVFKSCCLISQPYKPVPENPLDTSSAVFNGQTPIATYVQSRGFDRPRVDLSREKPRSEQEDEFHNILRSLEPPRKHWRKYNASVEAADHYRVPAQGLHAFFRGYYHLKSAVNTKNQPYPLTAGSALGLVDLPYYYIMPLASSMPETVAVLMVGEDAEATKAWLSDDEIKVYAQEWERTGFQGALNSFRAVRDPDIEAELCHYAGLNIKVPTTYICGHRDWGTFEEPDVLQQMTRTCSDFRGIKIVRDAAHWPHEEQPAPLAATILQFIWTAEQKPRQRTPTSETRAGAKDSTSSHLRAVSESPHRSPPQTRAKDKTIKVIQPLKNRADPSSQQDRSIMGQLQQDTSQSDYRGRSTSGATSELSNTLTKQAKTAIAVAAPLGSPTPHGLNRTGSAAPAPEKQERRKGPDSIASVTAEQGSSPSSRNHSGSRSRSVSRKDPLRSSTPADRALMGKESRDKSRQRRQPSTSADSMAEVGADSVGTYSSATRSQSQARADPVPQMVQRPSARVQPSRSNSDRPSSRNRTSERLDKANVPPRPDSATIAEENARIYKEVQENAWRALHEAERSFHRMGMSVSRREAAEAGIEAARQVRAGAVRERSASAGARYRYREEGGYKYRESMTEEDLREQDRRRKERAKVQAMEFDLRTHPGTAVATRDVFEAPAEMRE